MKKLTLVSMSHRGKLVYRFVMALVVNGKAVISETVWNDMISSTGAQYGDTVTIG